MGKPKIKPEELKDTIEAVEEEMIEALPGFTKKQMYLETPNVFDFECNSCKERMGAWDQKSHKCKELDERESLQQKSKGGLMGLTLEETEQSSPSNKHTDESERED